MEIASETRAGLRQLRERLMSAVATGARTFDGPTVALVDGLLRRAARVGGGASERLRQRAAGALAALEARFRAARERATRDAQRVAERGRDRAGSLRRAAERGDFTAVRRAARRYGKASSARRSAPAPEQQAQPAAPRRRSPSPAERYRVSSGELAALLSVERAIEAIPDEVGLYNGAAIAARALQTMAGLHSSYLRTQLERFGDLAVLAGLPDPTPPKVRKKRR